MAYIRFNNINVNFHSQKKYFHGFYNKYYFIGC
jgi:hypothetical protein